MKRPQLLAMAAVLLSSVAVPAFAAWDHIGTVNFSFRNDRDTQYGNFGGSVEALMLQARDSDVMCNNVTATFGNGQTREVYRGYLRRDREVAVDLPGQNRLVRRLDFNCHAMSRRGGTVDIAADVGRFQAEWRRSPEWDRVWSRMFNWGNDVIAPTPVAAGPGTGGWMMLGTENFEGGRDRETTFTGFRGRNVETIGLRPMNNDAQCNRVMATFGNGRTRTLATAVRMRENRIYEYDLPGNDRNITRIDLDCRAMGGRQVAIQVLAADLDRGGPGQGPGNWVPLGSERFEGPNDRETTVTGWRGRNIDTIALRPLNDDARCRSVTATFANGNRRALPINNGDMLRENRVFTVDLPGQDRNITRLDMNCRAEHGRAVIIQVLASR